MFETNARSVKPTVFNALTICAKNRVGERALILGDITVLDVPLG